MALNTGLKKSEIIFDSALYLKSLLISLQHQNGKEESSFSGKFKGLVVQLVRMPACHAGGRGFESRPDRFLDFQTPSSHRVRGFFMLFRTYFVHFYNYPMDFYVKSITSEIAQTITLKSNSIVVFVGANNVGKSLMLLDINTWLANFRHPSSSKGVKVTTPFNKDEITTFLENDPLTYKKEYYQGPDKKYTFKKNGREMNLPIMEEFLEKKINSDIFYQFFVKFLECKSRLSSIDPVQKGDTAELHSNNPMLALEYFEEEEQRLSKIFFEAFETDLVVNRLAGKNTYLCIGKKPTIESEESCFSSTYRQKFDKLKKLHEQGHGMISFATILINCFLGNYKIQLIDEPEAYLHPPQARLLGRMISGNLPSFTQIFIATHSSDIIKGLLDSNSDRVKIVRLERDGDSNIFTELDNENLKLVWSNPILKYSYVIEGIFHKQVVICEGDADCTFYQAILDNLIDTKKLPSLDVMFTHSNGKDKIGEVARALVKLGVPVKVIADFDLLRNNGNKLKELYEILGGNWEEIESEIKVINQDIENTYGEKYKSQKKIKQELTHILNELQDEKMPLSSKVIQDIKRTVSNTSGWSKAKKIGFSSISRGQTYQKYLSLSAKLNKVGIYFLEIGELENFIPLDVQPDENILHGGKWVNRIFSTYDLNTSSEYDIAKKFISKVFGINSR